MRTTPWVAAKNIWSRRTLVILAIGIGSGVAPALAEQMNAGAGAVVDPSLEPYLPTVGLKGKLDIVGSDTMQQLLSRFAGEFKKWYPGVMISVETEGSLAGFEQFMEQSASGRATTGSQEKGMAGDGSTVVILAASLPLTPEQVHSFTSTLGYPPLEVQIALGAVAIYVHESNPLRQLTLEQLDAMFGIARKRGASADITRWGQVDLKGEWEQKPIHLYGRDKYSGTRAMFNSTALLNGEFKTNVKEEHDINSLVLAISNDPLAIGYAGILYKDYSFVKLVALAEKPGKPFAVPNAEAVRRETYPLGRKLYLYANKPPRGELSPLVREYIGFAHSREGQELVVMSGFFPLPINLLSRNLAILGKRPETK